VLNEGSLGWIQISGSSAASRALGTGSVSTTAVMGPDVEVLVGMGVGAEVGVTVVAEGDPDAMGIYTINTKDRAITRWFLGFLSR